MYNTSVYSTLPPSQSSAKTWLSLEVVGAEATSEAGGVFSFLVNPDEEVWSHKSDFATIPVRSTDQPLTNYKNSDTKFSLPKVRLYTPDNARSLQPYIDKLVSFTKPTKPGYLPPLLKLTYGELILPQVYLVVFDITIKLRTNGVPVMGEAKMEFLIAPTPPKVTTIEPPPATSVSANKVLAGQTDREQSATLQKLTTKLLEDKDALSKLTEPDKKAIAAIKKEDLPQYTPKLYGDAGITISEAGEFKVNQTVVYTVEQVKTIAGVDLSPPKEKDNGDVTMKM